MAGTWTYDPALIATSALYQVRTLIADVNIKDQLLWDEQISFAISQRNGNIYAAGADCCRQIAAKYSRDVDTTEGLLHRSYSVRQRAFADRAGELDARAKITGKGAAIAGGISRQDKREQNADTDRVMPAFLMGLTDNWLPVAPVDNEVGNDSGRAGSW